MFRYIFLFLLLSHCVFASPAAEHLNQLLANVHTLQAHFSQIMTDKNAKIVQKTTGELSIIRPNRFRWEVLQPLPQLVVTNGTRLWIYDPDLEQVTIRFLTAEIGDSPAMLLSHTAKGLDKDFIVQERFKKDNQSFSLTPKNPDSLFANIQLIFSQKVIDRMILKDHLDHTTIIQFSEIALNHELPSQIFSFKPQANVDVIDETHS